ARAICRSTGRSTALTLSASRRRRIFCSSASRPRCRPISCAARSFWHTAAASRPPRRYRESSTASQRWASRSRKCRKSSALEYTGGFARPAKPGIIPFRLAKNPENSFMTASDTFRPAEMAKAYEAQQVEQRLYEWWERLGFFTPKIDPNRKPFALSMPPPNVTGELHMGHAMFVTIEDVIVRWHRMLGEPTLWRPGTDHAGIATQTQVEKLLRSEGMSRQEIGREEFLRRTWEWKAKYGGEITRQLRRLGASCDWSRERFTLDPGLSRAVRAAFKRLYDDALIYRGTYLVNWSPNLQTAVSDLEVEHEERQGNLWYVRYPLEATTDDRPPTAEEGESVVGGRSSVVGEWGSGKWAEGATEWITVATTRP